jgi:hypothetical protein
MVAPLTPLPSGEREGPARASAWEGEGTVRVSTDISSSCPALTLLLSPKVKVGK